MQVQQAQAPLLNAIPEHILRAATAAFARYGYYGTSVRDIAREVGLTVAGLYYHISSKDALYRAVFYHQYQEERELIEGFLRNAPADVVQSPAALRELVFALMDALIDRSLQHPDVVRLWMRRWLEQPVQTEDIEQEVSLPLYRMVEDLLVRARQAGSIYPADDDGLALVVHSFTWLHYGYAGFGRLAFSSHVPDAYQPEGVQAFRGFVRGFVRHFLRFSDET